MKLIVFFTFVQFVFFSSSSSAYGSWTASLKSSFVMSGLAGLFDLLNLFWPMSSTSLMSLWSALWIFCVYLLLFATTCSWFYCSASIARNSRCSLWSSSFGTLPFLLRVTWERSWEIYLITVFLRSDTCSPGRFRKASSASLIAVGLPPFLIELLTKTDLFFLCMIGIYRVLGTYSFSLIK